MARKLFKMGEQLGHEMRVLDLGGGFPGCAEEREFFDRVMQCKNLLHFQNCSNELFLVDFQCDQRRVG